MTKFQAKPALAFDPAMKFIALFALFALSSGSELVAKDNTITKVVKLLQTMLDKSVTEGDAERKIYAKFKCYCDTSEAEKENDSYIQAIYRQYIGNIYQYIPYRQFNTKLINN